MRRALLPLLVATATTAAVTAGPQPPGTHAAAPVEFGRDVVPILEDNCLRCHNTSKTEGGLLVESYEDLMRGGDTGAPIVPGQPDDSPFILQVEGRAKPKMPPKADLQPDEIATLRAWVASGAKDSPVKRPSLDEKVPALTQAADIDAPASSVAWRPDGREIAVAGYRRVARMALPGGEWLGEFGELQDQVRSVAWSRDGAMLAAGGGTPGAFGEVVLFDAASGRIRARLEGHRDYVYHVAFNNDGTRLASCGYDRSIRVWDTRTGRPVAVLKEHTEAVYAVAFSDDGAVLASAAADRSVKIWKVDDGTRLYTITDPTDAVLTLAFRRGTRQLAAGGQDKRLRIWEIGDAAARPIVSTPAHGAAVLRVAFSEDGALLATTGADRQVKLWDVASGTLIRSMGRQSDWAPGLDFSPDARQLAVGRYDGTVTVYDTASGKPALDRRASARVARR